MKRHWAPKAVVVLVHFPRLHECNWGLAWKLLVESFKRQVEAEIEDLQAAGADSEAEKMETKLKYVVERIPILRGAPHVKDVMKAFVDLERKFMKNNVEGVSEEDRAPAGDFSIGVGYLVRDLKVNDP